MSRGRTKIIVAAAALVVTSVACGDDDDDGAEAREQGNGDEADGEPIRIGTLTISVRLGFRRTSWTLGSRFMILAAWSSWARAWSQPLPLTGDSFVPIGGPKGIPGWELAAGFEPAT